MGNLWARAFRASFVVLLGTCGGTHEPTSRVLAPRDLDLPGRIVVTPAAHTSAPAPQPQLEPPNKQAPEPLPRMTVFGEEFRSFVVKDEERIYASPRTDDNDIGYLASRTRVVVKTLGAQNGDCKWMELAPRGWICARGKPSPLPPSGETAPALWMPGYDGRVYRDEADVRAKGGYVPEKAPQIDRSKKSLVTIDKKAYWHTIDGELVPWSAVPRYWGDTITGVSLEGVKDPLALPIAWTWNYASYRKPTRVYAEPSRRGRVVREIELRSRVVVHEEEGRWVRIGDGEFVGREDLRIVRVTAPPADVTGTDEVWIDVSLTEQTLVLYRGKTPIHATLVSTGKPDFNTPPGVFRVRKKTTVTEFKSPRPDLAEYHIKDVAWALHFTEVHALHGAWWHRGFGANVSMGCVNLPSYDMRAVYEAVEPKMVPGWWTTKATADHPGSVVRVRY